MKNTENVDSGGDPKSTKAKLQEAWQSTLGRFATADEGSKALVQRLVDWGKLTREEGKSLMVDWRESIENNRKLLEKRVEEAVLRSVSLFRWPSKRELQDLDSQVQELELRVRKLSNK